MVKYDANSTMVCMSEIPDYISLGISITNCAGRCEGCHSPWLREDIGEELTEPVLDELIRKNEGINCVLFLGEGKDKERIFELGRYVRDKYPSLKTAIYSGRSNVEDEYYKVFDFIKIGSYNAKYGPLNKRTTNQILLEVDRDTGLIKDITSRFWR
mgnify:CR=1 FL=1